MEHAAVRNFINQLDEHLTSHTAQYTSTYGEITAQTADYIGDGGSGSQSLLPLLDEHHTNVVNTLTHCSEVLNQHLQNNSAGDQQQHEAMQKANSVAASSITTSLT